MKRLFCLDLSRQSLLVNILFFVHCWNYRRVAKPSRFIRLDSVWSRYLGFSLLSTYGKLFSGEVRTRVSNKDRNFINGSTSNRKMFSKQALQITGDESNLKKCSTEKGWKILHNRMWRLWNLAWYIHSWWLTNWYFHAMLFQARTKIASILLGVTEMEGKPSRHEEGNVFSCRYSSNF